MVRQRADMRMICGNKDRNKWGGGFEFRGEVKDREDNICAFWGIITPKKD